MADQTTDQNQPTEKQIQEAQEAGINRGWTHANYVDTYPLEGETGGPDYPGWLCVSEGPFGYVTDDRVDAAELRVRLALRPVFDAAWEEGVELHRSNRWQNGRSRDED
jgi:hypothetical protein